MLSRMGLGLGGLTRGKGAGSAPSQFAFGDWSVADLNTVTNARITITALPYDGGSAITDLQYSVDGGAFVSLGGTTTGDYDIGGLEYNVQVAIIIRAVNAIGAGPNSTNKAVTPTGLAETDALAARFTTPPTTARAVLINTLIGSLITGGVWSKFDAFYMLAAANAQSSLLNWVSTSFNLTAVNSPALVVDRGYTGDGSTSYLDTGFNPITAPTPKFVQDSAHMGIWSRTNLNNGGAASNDIGSSNSHIARQAGVSGQAVGRCNTGAGVVFAPGAYLGHACWSRTAAAVWEGYAQGIDGGGGTDVSAAITSANIRVLSMNASSFGVNQIATAHIGSGLTAGEVLATYNAVQTYLQAIGAA